MNIPAPLLIAANPRFGWLLPTVPKGHIEEMGRYYMLIANFVPDADARFAVEYWREVRRDPASIPAASPQWNRFMELSKQADTEQKELLAEIQAFAKEQGLPISRDEEGAKDAKGSNRQEP